MSQSIRQSNLFSGEDFTKVYQSFKNVDFQAYDFDTIKSALIVYIKEQFPEDFNDYVESSEFIAILELLAYLGTSLSFRTDLNSRENFMDTAERRESIIRLARMVNYQPKRNIPAEGLFKLSGVSTTEPTTDSLGVDLTNQLVMWEDVNNSAAYEQIITIINKGLSSSNTFGRPFKKGTISGVKTHLYKINSRKFSSIVYPTGIKSEGTSYPVDIVNTDFNDGETFFERHPNPDNAMHILYRNDSNGLSSSDTGFFLHFKQGSLTSHDYNYAFPLENRVEEIPASNVNNDDVYVQKIKSTGEVIEEWTKVPSIVGSNVVYNSVALETKTIFSVISGFGDSVSIKYSDGNFGDVPKDAMRVWTRTSANESITFRPDDATNKSINIPYIGKNGREYVMTLVFSLETSVSNRALSETNEEIKENAPQVFYTQDRMVNNEDYNVFPLTRGNEIAKARTVNRTHSGHSRYIDINDPTGQHSDIMLFADDGAIYKEISNFRTSVEIQDTITPDEIISVMQAQLENEKLKNFFFDTYITDYKSVIGVNDFFYDLNDITWNTLPTTSKSDTGSLYSAGTEIGVDDTVYRFIKEGAKLKFTNPNNTSEYNWVTIKSLINSGITPANATQGPFILSAEVYNDWSVTEVIPAFRTQLNEIETLAITNIIGLEITFGLRYDLLLNEWLVVLPQNINNTDEFGLEFQGNVSSIQLDASWLMDLDYNINEGIIFPEYDITTRGQRYIFESAEEIRFFYDSDQNVFDPSTGKAVQDEIVITDLNRMPQTTEVWTYDSNINEWNLENSTISYSGNTVVLPDRNMTESDITVLPQSITHTVTNGILTITSALLGGDVMSITYKTPTNLAKDIAWNISGKFIMADGYVDQRKVEIIPVDSDEDGVADDPMSFDAIVNQLHDRVFFERFTDFDDYEYYRVWAGTFVTYDGSNLTETEIDSTLFTNVNLIIVPSILLFLSDLNALVVPNDSGMSGTAIYDQLTNTFYNIAGTSGIFGVVFNKLDYKIRIGRSHVAPNGTSDPLLYKWRHVAPSDHRIDPSISNIQDMLILTQTYYNDVVLWKKEQGTVVNFPAALTSEELRIQFAELNKFKMLSDQIVFEAAKFRVLFGDQAAPELKARFKIVALPNAALSDNEIKSKTIDAIDTFFEIANWGFGEAFYYTELAAYVHQQLQKSVASIVIVPSNSDSEFGNLFQIKAEVNELFISTANVNHIDIVKSLTETNLRIK